MLNTEKAEDDNNRHQEKDAVYLQLFPPDGIEKKDKCCEKKEKYRDRRLQQECHYEIVPPALS